MMKRRDFVKGVAATAIATGCIRSLDAKPTRAPNLLIIHTDEHNFRTLGCYRDLMPKEQALMWGNAVVETPEIDSIANDGAICTSFYATTPVCSPSRGSFVSGRYPQNTPVVRNNIPMDDAVISFAEMLKRNGYATGYAGKWHLDGHGKPQWDPQRDFGFSDNRYMFNRGHWKKLEDSSKGPRVAARRASGGRSYSVDGADPKSYTTDYLTDKALDFIDAHKDKPFCYMLSIPDPHGPNSVRAPYNSMYAGEKIEFPKTFHKGGDATYAWAGKQKGGMSRARFAKLMHSYYGMVKCIDDNVGRIIAKLKQDGLYDNTILVFTSDHGDMCGEHARVNKGVPYESSARIPFVIRYPEKIKAGTVIDQALTCVDFMPTALDLIGSPLPDCIEGRDAAGLFTGDDADWKDVAFFRSTGGKNNWIAAVTSRYKLIFSNKGDPCLFDLERDPDELRNFIADADYGSIARRLAGDLLEYARKYNDPYVDDPLIRKQIDAVMG